MDLCLIQTQLHSIESVGRIVDVNFVNRTVRGTKSCTGFIEIRRKKATAVEKKILDILGSEELRLA